jgi:hypothetical protein
LWPRWAELTIGSWIDSATTGLGNSEYQSDALAVKMAGRGPAR